MPVPNWVRFRSAGYTLDKGIHIGALDEPIFNPKAKAFGKYCIGIHPASQAGAPICDDKLNVLANNAFDYVFVARAIEVVGDVDELIGQAVQKLKVGGHLMFHLPINAEEKMVIHKFEPTSTAGLITKHASWMSKGEWIEGQEFFQVFKKTSAKPGGLRPAAKKPSKSACVIRYGAIGDAIIMTPLIRKLKEDGYHVTVNCTPYCYPPLLHNPNIDNVIMQEREAIPNHQLGPYWDMWRPDYDRYINLSESIEGKLLFVEGRAEFYTPQLFRHAKSNINYTDQTMALGGYPEAKGCQSELYFNHDERKAAEHFLRTFKDKFIVLWALNGSSYHKIYPLMQPVLESFLASRPDALVITSGDYGSKLHEFDHPQVIKSAGELGIRQVLCLTKYVNCVIGPETGVMNAASCFDTPKIVFLSHSTEHNLCKYWRNVHPLQPDTALAPCYPCHQLHYTRESCPLATVTDDRTGKEIVSGPICAMGAIHGEVVEQKLAEVYNTWKCGKID